MKKHLFTLLLSLLFLNVMAQTDPSLKSEAKKTIEIGAINILGDVMKKIRDSLNELPQNYQNKKNTRKTNEENKNRCPDTLECKLDSIANEIVKAAKARGIKHIAVWSFTDTIYNYGGQFADKLTIALTSVDTSIRPLEREQISVIMKEYRLSEDGFIDKKTATEIGNATQAEVIITGKIRIKNKVVYVDMKMIDIKTFTTIWGDTYIIPLKEEDKQPKSASSNSRVFRYSLPPLYYIMLGSADENCAQYRTGVLQIKNLTGDDIIVEVLDFNHRNRQYIHKIASGDSKEIPLPQNIYIISIYNPSNTIEYFEGEIIIRSCQQIGYKVR
jgi:TolB-like protein